MIFPEVFYSGEDVLWVITPCRLVKIPLHIFLCNSCGCETRSLALREKFGLSIRAIISRSGRTVFLGVSLDNKVTFDLLE